MGFDIVKRIAPGVMRDSGDRNFAIIVECHRDRVVDHMRVTNWPVITLPSPSWIGGQDSMETTVAQDSSLKS